MSSLVIERVVAEDGIDDVLTVENVCFSGPWTREMYRREIEQPELSHIYTARDANGVVGFCSCWLVVDEWHINNLGVMPAARRRGVARTLLRHVMDEGARLGALRATLEVRRSNDAARALYAAAGFLEAGVRRAYYTTPIEDAIVLWREGLARA